MKAVLIPLSDIALDPRLQMRERMSAEAIDDYSGKIDELPPAKVKFDEDGRYWLYDGWHTHEAHKRAGKAEMPCLVTKGSFRDALIAAASANETHGVRRTAADRRKAVQIVLSEDEFKDASDRVIADICKVDHKTVGAIREKMPKPKPPEPPTEPTGEIPQLKEPEKPAKRKGRDGKTRVVPPKPTKSTQEAPKPPDAQKPNGAVEFDWKAFYAACATIQKQLDAFAKAKGLVNPKGAIVGDVAYRKIVKELGSVLEGSKAWYEKLAKKKAPK